MKIINHHAKFTNERIAIVMRAQKFDRETKTLHMYWLHLSERFRVIESAVKGFDMTPEEALDLKWEVFGCYNCYTHVGFTMPESLTFVIEPL